MARELQISWDPEKAKRNLAKHGVAFAEGATVLLDPLAVTIFDEEHSRTEDRWITVGHSRNGSLLVVVHTWEDLEANRAAARIISARPATAKETEDYQEEP